MSWAIYHYPASMSNERQIALGIGGEDIQQIFIFHDAFPGNIQINRSSRHEFLMEKIEPD
jgi:hypothetical protein